MPDLKLTLIQTSLYWEDPENNRKMLSDKLKSIKTGTTDLIVLPEMFTTGFSMNAEILAEKMEGPSMKWMAENAALTGSAVAGSLIIRESNKYFNRLIWMNPDGKYRHYDKRHLFRMAGEDRIFSPGNERIWIELKKWRISPLICYDLRFPVWSRNRNNDTDIFIYVANWPRARRNAWRILLPARAVENQCYVIGVNRIGKDGNGQAYSGDTAVYDPKGECLLKTPFNREGIESIILNRKRLDQFRQKFQVVLDADPYELKEGRGLSYEKSIS